ncbi:hypothetical protein [Paradevosia shaoguanensis]|uniref:hypothetical protein n=1 Tax=Paradevosia shaoguanensis TaxID=1335043 RepID=UPI003C7183DC
MLAARYHALRDRTVRAVDRVLAEPVKIVKAGNPPFEIEAVLRTRDQAGADRSARSQAFQSTMVGVAAHLHVDGATYPGFSLSKGDRVQAIARRGAPWFEVLNTDPRQTARIIVNLTEG